MKQEINIFFKRAKVANMAGGAPQYELRAAGVPHRRKNGGHYARKNSSPGGSVCISAIMWERIPSEDRRPGGRRLSENASKYSPHSLQAAQWVSKRIPWPRRAFRRSPPDEVRDFFRRSRST